MCPLVLNVSSLLYVCSFTLLKLRQQHCIQQISFLSGKKHYPIYGSHLLLKEVKSCLNFTPNAFPDPTSVVSLVEINQVAIHLPSKYVKHYTVSNRCKGAQDSTANSNSVTIKLIRLCHIHKHSQLCIWGCTHGSCGKL